MPPPSIVRSASLGIVHASATTLHAISFEGVNVQPGDRAKWVRADATSCSSEFDATTASLTLASSGASSGGSSGASSGDGSDGAVVEAGMGGGGDGNVSAVFKFPPASGGQLILCYRFNYAQQAEHPGKAKHTPYILFPSVRLTVLRFDKVLPSGTAVGCASALVVIGAGFASRPAVGSSSSTSSTAEHVADGPSCGFGSIGSESATVLNDTHLVCTTPVPTDTGTVAMRVDFGRLTSALPDAFPGFEIFDASASAIASVWPVGGAYNLAPIVHLRGTFGRALGTPLCRFGNWTSPPLAGYAFNATHLTCRKPPFPNSARGGDEAVHHAVHFSPNGQCWPVGGMASDGAVLGASYATFNSQVDSLEVGGVPATGSVPIELRGAGFVFPALTHAGVCRYTAEGIVEGPGSVGDSAKGVVVTSGLEVLSPTRVRCTGTPAGGQVSTWRVEVLQNGVDPEPSPRAVQLSTYDLSAVRVSAVIPLGGPVGVETAVTVLGSGFATYGAGHFVCRIGSVHAPAVMLDATRTLCTLPPLGAAGSFGVTVSLNNGTAGTFSVDSVPFEAYYPPYLSAVSPVEGDAQGGTTVTVFGRGFLALSVDAATRAGLLRCRFGGVEAATVQPLSHTDTQVVCVTPWGEGEGQPVRIALNSHSFRSRKAATIGSPPTTETDGPSFMFKGLHPPALVEAYFTPDSTTLVIRFDSQVRVLAGVPDPRFLYCTALPCSCFSLLLADGCSCCIYLLGPAADQPRQHERRRAVLDRARRCHSRPAPRLIGIRRRVLLARRLNAHRTTHHGHAGGWRHAGGREAECVVAQGVDVPRQLHPRREPVLGRWRSQRRGHWRRR